MANDIPKWAHKRASELAALENNCVYSVALARYIAANEEPPVDPLHVEAARLVLNAGFAHDGACFDIALVALRRGIELGRPTNTGEAV